MLMSDMLPHTVSTVLERNYICLKALIVSTETLGTIENLDFSLEIIPHDKSIVKEGYSG